MPQGWQQNQDGTYNNQGGGGGAAGCYYGGQQQGGYGGGYGGGQQYGQQQGGYYGGYVSVSRTSSPAHGTTQSLLCLSANSSSRCTVVSRCMSVNGLEAAVERQRQVSVVVCSVSPSARESVRAWLTRYSGFVLRCALLRHVLVLLDESRQKEQRLHTRPRIGG